MNEWRSRAVPHCKGRCSVRHTEPSVGKRGAIGLPLKQALIGQSREEGLVAVSAGEIQINQGVVLESAYGATYSAATATAWEKPMREVGRTTLPRPAEQCTRDDFLVTIRCGLAGNQRVMEPL